MQACEFPEQNTIFAKDQKEYYPLPAHKTDDGIVTTCWELTPGELEEVKRTGKIYFRVLTFNSPLQPQLASTVFIKD